MPILCMCYMVALWFGTDRWSGRTGLAPRLRAFVDADELERLQKEAEAELDEPGRWGTSSRSCSRPDRDAIGRERFLHTAQQARCLRSTDLRPGGGWERGPGEHRTGCRFPPLPLDAVLSRSTAGQDRGPYLRSGPGGRACDRPCGRWRRRGSAHRPEVRAPRLAPREHRKPSG